MCIFYILTFRRIEGGGVESTPPPRSLWYRKKGGPERGKNKRYLKSKTNVFNNIIWKKLYSWGISQNINKSIPVNDWPSEWQTENTSTVNIFNMEYFSLHKVSSITFILDDIKKTKKNVNESKYGQGNARDWLILSEWQTENTANVIVMYFITFSVTFYIYS